MKFASILAIGGSAANQNPNGFVGCMRAFTLNGKVVDLMNAAKINSFGKLISSNILHFCQWAHNYFRLVSGRKLFIFNFRVDHKLAMLKYLL